MSGGVPDGVVDGLWGAIRSQAFDRLQVGPLIKQVDIVAGVRGWLS